MKEKRVTAGPFQIPAAERAEWHPRLQKLYEYWVSIRPADRSLPGRQHFDPCDIPDLLSALWLLDVQRAPFRLKYRLVGTQIVAAQQGDYTGRWLDEVDPHLLDTPEFFERYRLVVDTGMPDRRRGRRRMALEKANEVENLVVPLATDGRNPDILVVCSVLYDMAGRELFSEGRPAR
jgi:hypothetical protein